MLDSSVGSDASRKDDRFSSTNKRNDKKFENDDEQESENPEEAVYNKLRTVVLTDPEQVAINIDWLMTFKKVFFQSNTIKVAYAIFEERDPTLLLQAFSNNIAVLKLMTSCQPYFSNIGTFVREINMIHRVAVKLSDMMLKAHDLRMTVQSMTAKVCQSQELCTMFRFFCETASRLQLRRTTKGAIYAPGKSDGYEYKCNVEEWIWRCVTPEWAHPLEWGILVQNNGLEKKIVRLLKVAPDPQFPWL